MAGKKNTSMELALMDSFAIVNRYEGIDPELLAELKDEMEDLDPESGITCRQIKVPSVGGLAFEVQGENEGDAEPMKEIDAVIVFTHRLSAYWPGSFGSASNPEEKILACTSMDGKTGIVQNGDQTGEILNCETCPYNQYGTSVDEKGDPSRGKACKNMRRIYMMMDRDPNFYLLTVPPTSIKDVNKQLAKILASGTPYTGMIVTFGLEKTKNNNGVAYSKAAIKQKGILPPAVAAQVIQIRNQIKAQYQSMPSPWTITPPPRSSRPESRWTSTRTMRSAPPWAGRASRKLRPTAMRTPLCPSPKPHRTGAASWWCQPTIHNGAKAVGYGFVKK